MIPAKAQKPVLAALVILLATVLHTQGVSPSITSLFGLFAVVMALNWAGDVLLYDSMPEISKTQIPKSNGDDYDVHPY
jgi:hypothetical protein